MSIYIAGASAEVFRAVRAHEEAERLGLPVVSTWTKHVVANRGKGVMDHHLTPEEARVEADRDEEELATAEVFWLLVPQEPSRGAYFELGMFCGRTLGADVIASGTRAGRCIFEQLRCDRLFDKPYGEGFVDVRTRNEGCDDAALRWLVEHYPTRT